MGMTGALKLRQIVENAERVLAIELMCAAQGLEFRRPLRPSVEIERAYDAVRAILPRLEKDRVLGTDIDVMAAAIRQGEFDSWCA
jgi:histidine ammonia-lyase